MIELTSWMPTFLNALQAQFGSRVWFVGLQGSYSRGEATETSDIDLVVVLDELDSEDIQTYRAMLDTLPHRELLCGFLSGKREIMNWEPSDLLHLCYDTKPIQGTLDEFLPLIDNAAVCSAIKIGACNIFHGCVHNMLYGQSETALKNLYKSASFLVQTICFQQTGRFIRRQTDLLELVSPAEQSIVSTFLTLKNGEAIEFDAMSEALFNWVKAWI